MLADLHVIARNSSFVYKKSAVSVPDVAKALGVRYVLEGSVRKAGNRVESRCNREDSRTGGHVWASRFDRDLTDIFAVQDELTQEIVGALKLKLSAGDQDRLTLRRGANVEAYELYLRGREQAWAATRTGNVAARGLLDRAIAMDAGYAAAYAVATYTHVLDYINAWTIDPEESPRIGRETAERAVGMAATRPALIGPSVWRACGVGGSTGLRRRRREASRCRRIPGNSSD